MQKSLSANFRGSGFTPVNRIPQSYSGLRRSMSSCCRLRRETCFRRLLACLLTESATNVFLPFFFFSLLDISAVIIKWIIGDVGDGESSKKVCPTPCWICGITLKISTIRLSLLIGGTYRQRYMLMLFRFWVPPFRNLTVRPKPSQMFQFPNQYAWKHCHPLADHVSCRR